MTWISKNNFQRNPANKHQDFHPPSYQHPSLEFVQAPPASWQPYPSESPRPRPIEAKEMPLLGWFCVPRKPPNHPPLLLVLAYSDVLAYHHVCFLRRADNIDGHQLPIRQSLQSLSMAWPTINRERWTLHPRTSKTILGNFSNTQKNPINGFQRLLLFWSLCKKTWFSQEFLNNNNSSLPFFLMFLVAPRAMDYPSPSYPNHASLTKLWATASAAAAQAFRRSMWRRERMDWRHWLTSSKKIWKGRKGLGFRVFRNHPNGKIEWQNLCQSSKHLTSWFLFESPENSILQT